MPLRLLEAVIPAGDRERIPELVRDLPVVHLWEPDPGAAEPTLRVLLDARDTEALSDLLVERFGSREGFRIVLLPVEATVPPVEEPEPEAAPVVPASDGPLRRISREELYEDLSEAARLTPVYALMVALSTVVAAVGLLRDDVAIVIGAMVIAPLLGPNVALSLSFALGDPVLARRSLTAIAAGVGIAGALSLLIGAVYPVDPEAAQIVTRTQPGVGDLILALAAGAAGCLAFTTGVPAVVVGVMVAVALLPPLVVAGLLAGAGHLQAATGALVLLMANITCVNLAAVGLFLLQRVRPRTWWEADRARRATVRAVIAWVVLLGALAALLVSGMIDAS